LKGSGPALGIRQNFSNPLDQVISDVHIAQHVVDNDPPSEPLILFRLTYVKHGAIMMS